MQCRGTVGLVSVSQPVSAHTCVSRDSRSRLGFSARVSAPTACTFECERFVIKREHRAMGCAARRRFRALDRSST
jgi:hypothetical protein